MRKNSLSEETQPLRRERVGGNMSDEELVKMVNEWWDETYRFVKLDECYGLDITTSVLSMLIKVRNNSVKLP